VEEEASRPRRPSGAEWKGPWASDARPVVSREIVRPVVGEAVAWSRRGTGPAFDLPG